MAGLAAKSCWAAVFLLIVAGSPALGQSDPGNFATVINVPPTPAPTGIGSNTQLNLYAGGALGNSFGAGNSLISNPSTNVEVNIYGGTVGESFRANSNSVVNILGGTVGQYMRLIRSQVNLRGGTMLNETYVELDSLMSISGGTAGYVIADNNGQIAVSGGYVDQVQAGTNGTNAKGTVTVTGGMVGTARAEQGVFNVSGGDITSGLYAEQQSQLSISGGNVGYLQLLDNSKLTLSGGTTERLNMVSGSARIRGSEFRIDGVLIDGLDSVGMSKFVTPPQGASLTGVLQDGTPFLFSKNDDDNFYSFGFTLEATATPTIGPANITAGADPVPLGIRDGQTLVVGSGATLARNFNAGRGSTVNIQAGGSVGDNFEAVHATVTTSGGNFGMMFGAFDGTVVNASQTTLGVAPNFDSSTLHFTDSTIGDSASATRGAAIDTVNTAIGQQFVVDASTLVVSSGTVGSSLRVQNGSSVTLAGGSVGAGMNITNSSLELRGGEFQINGQPVAGLDTVGDSVTVQLADDQLISGTFADGTPFAFSKRDADSFQGSQLKLTRAELPAVGPAIVAPGSGVRGLRNGQTMEIPSGVQIGDDFNAGAGSTMLVNQGGSIGVNLEATSANLIVNGGSVGTFLDLANEATASVNSGSVGSYADLTGGSTLTLNGGQVGSYLHSWGSTIVVNSGQFNERAEVRDGSRVDINGGTVGIYLQTYDTQVNITGGVTNALILHPNCTLTMSGGELRGSPDAAAALTSSTATITGGYINGTLSLSQSSANISGGRINAVSLSASQLVLSGGVLNVLSANSTSTITLIGDGFELDGAAVPGLNNEGDTALVTLNQTNILTATLADGTPAIFTDLDTFEVLNGVTVRLQYRQAPPATPQNFVASQGGLPNGLRAGQSLLIDAGGSVPANFVALRGSSITAEPGALGGGNLEAVGATIKLSGGGFGWLEAFAGTTVTIAGAQNGVIEAFASSKITFGVASSKANSIIAHAGSLTEISGGTVSAVSALAGSNVTITGGSIPRIDAAAQSIVNLVGTRFTVNGVDISATLPLYTPFKLTDRNKTLATFLLDGKILTYGLTTTSTPTGSFNIDAILNLVRALPGDFNLDQVVDAADYILWRKNGGTSTTFNGWRASFGRNNGGGAGASASVPEPGALSLLALAGGIACCAARRR